MAVLFEVGKAYSFSVHPSNIIENVFDQAVCLATYSADIASIFLDLEAIHAQVYPYLPSGTPDSPLEYNYVQFQLPDGSKKILGIPWINIDTITVSDVVMLTIKVRGVTANDINEVRAILQQKYNDIEITVGPNIPKNSNNTITSTLHQP